MVALNYSKPFVAIALAFGVIAGSQAQIVKTKAGYLFRVKYTQGQVVKLDTTTSSANKHGADFMAKMPVTLSVMSVKKGIANVKIDIGVATSGGKPIPGLKPQSVTVNLNDRNQTNAAGVPGHPLPTHPMQIGSTWDSVVPVTMGGVLKKLEGTYRFVGLKMVDGNLVAIVTYSVKGAATGSGSMMLLAKDGSLFSDEMLLNTGTIDTLHITFKRRK